MRIVYVLLSPTFGMHQYTADIANRMVCDGCDVHLVTTTHLPRDRYAANVTIHTPVATTNTGLSGQTLRFGQMQMVTQTILDLQPEVVHFTGPHLWNVPILRTVKQHAIPVIHTIHDMDAHSGTRFGALLQLWNKAVIHNADHILVHGRVYRQRLMEQGISAERITYAPLMHLFLDHQRTAELESQQQPIEFEPFALFFGRLERYKGLDFLLTAFAQMADIEGQATGRERLVLAGSGNLPEFWVGQLPQGVELLNGMIDDNAAIDLFERCSLVLLPYIDATQSALISAAYFFSKPVLVSRAGALTEYVEDGVTGFVVEPDHPPSLARTLCAALSDLPHLAEMGRAGRRWYDAQRANEHRILANLYQHSSRTPPPSSLRHAHAVSHD